MECKDTDVSHSPCGDYVVAVSPDRTGLCCIVCYTEGDDSTQGKIWRRLNDMKMVISWRENKVPKTVFMYFLIFSDLYNTRHVVLCEYEHLSDISIHKHDICTAQGI